ncbi:peroxiredoxin type II [Haematococcus lacustris]
MTEKVGTQLPDVVLYEGDAQTKVNLRELFAGKKGVLFAVPGAFTPGCSKTHLPGYVSAYEQFKEAGADIIVCVATNDPFVMRAWGAAHNVDSKVRMLSDMDCALTDALGVAMQALGCKRSRRFSAVIQDNQIKAWNLEEGGGMACSLSNPTLEQLKAL